MFSSASDKSRITLLPNAAVRIAQNNASVQIKYADGNYYCCICALLWLDARLQTGLCRGVGLSALQFRGLIVAAEKAVPRYVLAYRCVVFFCGSVAMTRTVCCRFRLEKAGA